VLVPCILAIDQATTVGVAFAEAGCEPVWGHWRMGKPKAEPDEIAEAFDLYLREQISRFRPDDLIHETPYIGSGRVPLNPQTILLLAWMAGHIGLVARQCGVRCWQQQTSTAVKFLTGRAKYASRKEKKLATMRACWARGWEATEDEADALALLMFAESKLYPEASRQRRMVLRMPRGPLFETHTAA